MKKLQYLLLVLMSVGILSGCGSSSSSSNNNNNNTETGTNTQFFSDVKTILERNENDEPLEITDLGDTTTSFDALL